MIALCGIALILLVIAGYAIGDAYRADREQLESPWDGVERRDQTLASLQRDQDRQQRRREDALKKLSI